MTRKAFTLIELLIVVAIIAILAAIAVPNFLEAQTRSKVSRFMADLRSSATAIEAYAVDHNKYVTPDGFPAGSDESVVGTPYWALPSGQGAAEFYLSHRLTTPIAYMSHLMGDVFAHGGDGLPVPHAPHYINDQFNEIHFAGQVDEMYFSARTKAGLKLALDPGTNASLYDRSVMWHAHSHGPDMDHDDFLGDAGIPIAYDATNGTISNGDIFYFGPGTGFTGK